MLQATLRFSGCCILCMILSLIIVLFLPMRTVSHFLYFHCRGPPRPRPVRDGEEDKENQGGEGGQNQQPRQRRTRHNYRRRRPQTGGKPGQENKEAKTGGDSSTEKTSAPEAQQGGAE